MIKYFIIVTFILFQTNCFGQIERSDKKEFIPFGPIETSPRFSEDINLSEDQNKKSFNQRIQSLFTKYFNNQDSLFINDTINIKAYIMFTIDSLGKAKYAGTRPDKILSKNAMENILVFIDSLPIFIPGKQRQRRVKVKYSFPVYSKKNQTDHNKTSKN